jgi:hypothetical protein
MNSHRDDPETLQDMYYKLAASYRSAPDLRLAVLDTLANIHIQVCHKVLNSNIHFL